MKAALGMILFLALMVGLAYYGRDYIAKNKSQTSASNTVVYTCNGDKSINATFFPGEAIPSKDPSQPPTLTGKVIVTFDNGKSAELPQTISADGGRYASPDSSIVFWDKGDT